jgi:hypothetical protein
MTTARVKAESEVRARGKSPGSADDRGGLGQRAAELHEGPDDDAGDGHIEPDREDPAREALVLLKAADLGQPDRPQDEGVTAMARMTCGMRMKR